MCKYCKRLKELKDLDKKSYEQIINFWRARDKEARDIIRAYMLATTYDLLVSKKIADKAWRFCFTDYVGK